MRRVVPDPNEGWMLSSHRASCRATAAGFDPSTVFHGRNVGTGTEFARAVVRSCSSGIPGYVPISASSGSFRLPDWKPVEVIKPLIRENSSDLNSLQEFLLSEPDRSCP